MIILNNTGTNIILILILIIILMIIIVLNNTGTNGMEEVEPSEVTEDLLRSIFLTSFLNQKLDKKNKFVTNSHC